MELVYVPEEQPDRSEAVMILDARYLIDRVWSSFVQRLDGLATSRLKSDEVRRPT